MLPSVKIIVNEKPIEIYRHEEKNYVEGRKGSEFSIMITNPLSKKILAIPSVDGISVLDGKLASKDSSGYVIQPYGSVTIPGWKLDQKEVAKFVFEAKENSYAATGDIKDTSNTGVIGVLFFEEKEQAFINSYYTKSTFRSFGNNSMMLCASSYSEPEPVEQKLGTGFGEVSEFKTNTVSFDRGKELGIITIFYDSKKNLIKKGVITKSIKENTPNPFPGDGCKPPKNWKK